MKKVISVFCGVLIAVPVFALNLGGDYSPAPRSDSRSGSTSPVDVVSSVQSFLQVPGTTSLHFQSNSAQNCSIKMVFEASGLTLVVTNSQFSAARPYVKVLPRIILSGNQEIRRPWGRFSQTQSLQVEAHTLTIESTTLGLQTDETAYLRVSIEKRGGKILSLQIIDENSNGTRGNASRVLCTARQI